MQKTQTIQTVWSTVVAVGCLLVASSALAFDMSPEAIAARTAFYNVPGRADLTGVGSPLKPSTKIDFFGDSITWLNVYVTNIQNAINTGAGTAGKNIVTVNRGDDGGGVLQILNGDPGTIHGYGGITQKSFAATIAGDHPNIAVVFIGINDVWWRGTPADTFRQGLQDIVTQGDAAGVTMVLATLAVNGERPDGSNPNDAVYDQYAQITRDVAASTGTSLVDLRTAYIDYEINNNILGAHRGGYLTQGLLTYDGVHPTTLGNNLLADQIAEGIYKALVPEPGVTALVMVAFGAMSVVRRRAD